MIVGTVTQQPTEKLSYTVNYTDSLTDGDTLKSATATVNIGGLTVSNVGVYNPRVKVWIEGGVSGKTYRVELNVESNHGRKFQDELIVKVKEI